MKVMRLKDNSEGLASLYCADEAEPTVVGNDEIKVRIHASSLNYHDYSVATGAIPTEGDRIPMSDGAGVVVGVGEGVTQFAPGDHVVSTFFPDWLSGAPTVGDFSRTPGDGIDGYAREVVVKPQQWFTKAPSGWSHEEAATITTAGLTAWRALVVEGGLKAGDTVLLLGTGGVSIYALQIAKAMGAKVAITSSSDEKLEKAKALGADFTVNYKTDEKWGKTVAKWTGGTGVDHVVEVGGPATLGQSIHACRVGGSIVLIGVLTGIKGDIPTATLMRKQIRLTGIIVGSNKEQWDFVSALECMNFKPVVDTTFALERLPDAFAFEASGKHFGKICVSL
ncbi:NAD(P)-dependent alcohol dehydrogenase [Alteromonas sp. K632G]|uniref:zinc-dependent alcohol dehydrogenase family protein n=1 Tax=Alteromonas sp. K632G TaxID=2820757 RepID=UPI001AD7DC86|nr:NAD(P)-dependent alcohol dehydrogenase [Alteromonas sp. K632G]MBO7923436.1 NAD(P)-dependent alcohol dehydrogenase [Alteromonas sp. K632G]